MKKVSLLLFDLTFHWKLKREAIFPEFTFSGTCELLRVMNSLQLLEFTVSILLAVCEVHAESRLNDTNLGPKTPFPKVWNRHETNNSYLSSMENVSFFQVIHW